MSLTFPINNKSGKRSHKNPSANTNTNTNTNTKTNTNANVGNNTNTTNNTNKNSSSSSSTSRPSATSTATATSTAAPLPLNPSVPAKKALDIPEIQNLFRTRKEEYIRRAEVRIQARLADKDDIGQILTSWIIDHNKNLLPETVKEFSPEEIEKGMVIMRYPTPLGKDKNTGEVIYNEWFVTKARFFEQYKETPVTGGSLIPKKFLEFESQKPTRKEGVRIDKRVIELLGGKNGLAILAPPWGGTMYAVQGGLLTSEGSSIGPDVVNGYYEKVTSGKDEKVTSGKDEKVTSGTDEKVPSRSGEKKKA